MSGKARLVGINHVALEVGDIDEALAFYGRFFEFTLRGRGGRMAFIDVGDQFVALAARPNPATGDGHFGLVVDDKEQARRALREAGVAVSSGPGLDFRDPWGNHVQVVEYSEIQFTKADHVLQGMGLGALPKTRAALEELERKGLSPDSHALP